MQKIKILSVVCLVFLGSVIVAQDMIVITGKVTDKKTGEPIPFVNIGVIGTYTGAATNMDGLYDLKIPSKYKEKELEISAVGYSTVKEKVADIAKSKTYNVELNPMAFEVGEVEILGESRLQYTRVKKAVENISKNYLQTPFNYDMYYRGELKSGDNVLRLREAAVRLYDNKGYERGDAYQVFKERGYDFLEVRKNFENETLADGGTYLDELLEMDIVRVRGNVLNVNEIDDYKLTLEGETEYQGDKIWIIAYENPNATLASTGDYYVRTYKGKLYIKQKDYAVVKNTMEVTASNYSPQGRSFYVEEARQNYEPQSISYKVTTTYKQHMDYYYLSYISYERNHDWKSKKTGEKKKESILAELLVTKIDTFSPQVIERRAYYENKPYNEEFWKSYNIIKDRE
ncbi:carboxypeptidase-like protein [Balneicella halophila]|uniref:Carboxypeptidase-like protein n=2 Tax=Balneicella halophila TaxID=1537566 RepID=A0A7L4URW1_BALHA|nr:carboxypeptidase-like protein [Balneicella halophila]